ncbi:MAG: OmpA family protein [Aureispira sp.]|nr:OmpA family protein [Aureispira sp.]
MAKIFQFAFMLLMFASLLSCVSNRKYQEEQTAKSQALNEAASQKKAREVAEKDLEGIKEKVKEMEEDYAEIKSDYDLLKTRYDQQQRLNKDLQDSYDKLLELNEKLKNDASAGKRELKEELAKKEDELRRKEDELRRREREMEELAAKLKKEREEIDKLKKDLEGKNANIGSLEDYKKKLEDDLAAREAKNKELGDALAAREKRVKELEDAIAARDAKAQALKDKLAAALTGFTSSDLSVEERNGKVYVSMSQNLLFATGSSKIASKGVGALENLAGVLNKSADIDIMVEGHTDSDGDAKMNWDLSSKRSLSVSNVLIKNSVSPERITAAGRGEHVPIASNDSDEGKAKNRRTEIILSPKLDEIFDILKN